MNGIATGGFDLKRTVICLSPKNKNILKVSLAIAHQKHNAQVKRLGGLVSSMTHHLRIISMSNLSIKTKGVDKSAFCILLYFNHQLIESSNPLFWLLTNLESCLKLKICNNTCSLPAKPSF